MTVLIAGGGIAGLALALTCHEIGVPCRVFESVPEIRPLGVGINLQPSAVRELFDLGLEAPLEAIGVRTRDYGMYTKRGLHIWTEPRGTWAGYQWPQYSVHRGLLHMMVICRSRMLKQPSALFLNECRAPHSIVIRAPIRMEQGRRHPYPMQVQLPQILIQEQRRKYLQFRIRQR